MSAAVLFAYAVGIVLGLLAARVPAFGRVWPVIVRVQILVAAITLSVVAVWRIDNVGSVLWPVLIALSAAAIFAVAWLTAREPNRDAHAVLQSWSANANTAFFVIPVAAALAGPAGATAAVLVDRIATPLYAYWIHLLRKGAPVPQRRRTSPIDQAPVIALGIGLLLHLTGPAPAWTATLTLLAAPLLAASGAAIFIGSVLHPSQRIDPRPGFRRWLALVALRVVWCAPIVALAPSPTYKVVAVLCALSIPAFAVPQMSTVYGYSDPVVAAGSRYGWVVGAVGLGAALLLMG
jgi:predicted permease